jgi:diacylglycerol kinase (ATP)
VNEVVNGLAGAGARDVEVAVVPRGTGYDFVRTFGIPRDLEQAVAIALSGDVREIDLGLVTYRTWAGAEGRAHFANVASAGISGAIAQRANETSKALGGKISYYWATLAVFARWQTGELRISVDDEIRGGRMIDAMIANGRFIAGGMMMLPEAEPDDGLFDVLLIGDVTKRDLLFTLPKTYRGKHLPHPRLEVLRGRVVSVDADEPLPLELDGEQPGTTPARFEIVPRALKLRVPRVS